MTDRARSNWRSLTRRTSSNDLCDRRPARDIEVGCRHGELACAAYATEYPAIVENDSEALHDAIGTGRDAIAHLESEAATAPRHAADAGELERVHLERWDAELASMGPSMTA